MSSITYDSSKTIAGRANRIIASFERKEIITWTDIDDPVYGYIKKPHSENDHPAVILGDGTRIWYKEGKKHRVSGPAEIRIDGTKVWFQNDILHREDGPAIIMPRYRMWYYNGKSYTQQIENWIKTNNIQLCYGNYSFKNDDDRLYYLMLVA